MLSFKQFIELQEQQVDENIIDTAKSYISRATTAVRRAFGAPPPKPSPPQRPAPPKLPPAKPDPDEAGVSKDTLAKKADLERRLGRRLNTTSGVRTGPGMATHGTSQAIDIGLVSNPMTKAQRNNLIYHAIKAGFTGIGAEYRAKGGPHIHLDTGHSKLTGWGTNTKSSAYKDIAKDNQWMAAHLANIHSGKAKGYEPRKTKK